MHQAGIVTPAQDRLHFAAFDLTAPGKDNLVGLLGLWTQAAARMVAGKPAGAYGPVSGPYDSPPDDTGEAMGLPPSGLTITFGFGPRLFDRVDGADRFGIAAKRPAALQDAGLFFLAYVRNPTTQYIPLQTKLSRDDAMAEYLQHTGSGLFAVPAGVADGEFVGQNLFD